MKFARYLAPRRDSLRRGGRRHCSTVDCRSIRVLRGHRPYPYAVRGEAADSNGSVQDPGGGSQLLQPPGETGPRRLSPSSS